MPYRTLDIEEVAEYLHLSTHDVDELVKTSGIPFQNRGGRVVFLRGEVDAWASQRILGLQNNKLVDYHQRSTRDTRSVFDQDALMPELIRPNYIDAGLQAKTRHSVVHDMVELAEKTGRVHDAIELRESVEAREEMCSTAVPGGVALLHCRQHEPYRFDGSFIVLGRSIQDVPFGAPDGRSTRFFFLLCCQDERLHLHALARVCMMAQKTDLIDRLYSAESADEIYEALVSCEAAALAGKKSPDLLPEPEA